MATIVVTGTSGGLGDAISAILIVGGHHVGGIARKHPSSPFLSENPLYSHWTFDLEDVAGISTLVRDVTAAHGPVFGLVNNAAFGADAILATMHSSDIDRVVRVNLISAIELSKGFVRPMLVNRTGRIINISSVVAKTGYKGLSVYAATKAGLEGFTRSLAREVGARGVTVNAVAPGFMDTSMTAALDPVKVQQIVRRTPLGRLVDTSDVAETVLFLMSERAKMITGQTIVVDGGASA